MPAPYVETCKSKIFVGGNEIVDATLASRREVQNERTIVTSSTNCTEVSIGGPISKTFDFAAVQSHGQDLWSILVVGQSYTIRREIGNSGATTNRTEEANMTVTEMSDENDISAAGELIVSGTCRVNGDWTVVAAT